MTWCPVPILWAPPGTGTQTNPMLSLTLLAEKVETMDPSIWACNVAAGFSFADTPESGLTLSVVTVGPADAARKHLQIGADLAWRLRDSGAVNYPGVEAVLEALPPGQGGPVLLVEPADNIGAGAGPSTPVRWRWTRRSFPGATAPSASRIPRAIWRR